MPYDCETVDWIYIFEYCEYLKNQKKENEEEEKLNNDNDDNIENNNNNNNNDDDIDFKYELFINWLSLTYKDKMNNGEILLIITAAKCWDCCTPIGFIKSLIGVNDKLSKSYHPSIVIINHIILMF